MDWLVGFDFPSGESTGFKLNDRQVELIEVLIEYDIIDLTDGTKCVIIPLDEIKDLR